MVELAVYQLHSPLSVAPWDHVDWLARKDRQDSTAILARAARAAYVVTEARRGQRDRLVLRVRPVRLT